MIEGIAAVLSIFLYILFLAVASLGIMLGIATGMGVVGAVLSVPLLYVLPDVRRFLVLASGGRAADGESPWRVVFRWRYLLLAAVFGFSYGVAFLILFVPVRELGLIHATVGPVPILLGIPLAFVSVLLPVVYALHRGSSAWTATTSDRSVLVQWAAFLSVAVAVGTAVPVAATMP